MRMRLHVLLLLLLTLPLRGWVGDAMAIEMAQAALRDAAVTSTAAATSTAPMNESAMLAGCPMHMAGHPGAQMTLPAHTADSHPITGTSHAHTTAADHVAHAAAAPADGEHPAGHTGACSLCDICHGASLADAATAHRDVVMPHAAPATANARFASVLRAPDLRPPIL